MEGVKSRGDIAVLNNARVGPCGEVLALESAGGKGPRGCWRGDGALCGLQFTAGDVATTAEPALEQTLHVNE